MNDYQEQMRCEICDAVCVSCAVRLPEFDTPYGPLCGQCVGNGQAEPYTEECTDHEHDENPCAEAYDILYVQGHRHPHVGEWDD